MSPVLRDNGFHGFLWLFGHRDYRVIYHVELTNHSEPVDGRVTLQLSSKSGHITVVMLPPIVRGRLIGGEELTRWDDPAHSTETTKLGIEMDLPAPGSKITITVAVNAVGGYVSDDDLMAQVMPPSGLLSTRGKTVSWE